MNKLCYKTIFSKRLGALVAVGEHAASQGKATGQFTGAVFVNGFSHASVFYIGVLTLSFALVSMAWAAPANNALPTGGQVAQGAAAISQSGANMAINQSTARAVVNWQSFDIGKDAKVNIVQPNAQAVMLNRVTGVAPSQIFGQMTANGQVVLVNPNGVTFGKDGSVSAAGLTASTLNTTDADFMAGRNRFTRDGATGQVINQGTLTAAPGGYVALLGASVSNEGKIVAPQGNVALGAAEMITLPLYGSSRIKMELTPSAINAAVANQRGGSIVSEGGQVYMQAAAVGSAIASVMQSGGIDTSGAQGGAVHLLADGGRIKVDGSITANSTAAGNKGGDIVIGRDEVTGVLAKSTDVSGAQLQSKGGFVETSGHYLKTEGISVKAKEWLLDPTDITIVATGTATADTASSTASGTTTYEDNTAVASSEVLKSTIESAINGGTNVTIKTSNTTAGATGAGNITIATALAFNNTGATDATLSLIADNGITQNSGASITTNAASTKLVNVTMTANGNYQGNTAASASSRGIVLNSTINTNGAVTVTGTSKNTGGGAGVQFGGGASITTKGAVTVDGTSTSGTGYGVSLNNTLIDAGTSGDILITGMSNGNHGVFNNSTSNNFYNMKLVGKDVTINGTTSGLNSSGFYSFIGNYAGNIIEAAGNIAITGTTNGTGTGSGLYYATTNWQKYVNSYTAGGSIALSGTNTSASNTAAAVRLFGVQAKTTGSGSVSVNASTQNASVNAIHIYSEKGQVPSGQTQISYQGGASSLVSTSGDVKIQANQGGILLNDSVPNSATPTTISGRNISIDNTGGNIDTTSGAITKGSGKSTSANSGITINDARAITATGNINLYGVGTSGSGVEISAAAALTAANITINGENTGTSGAAINISHAAATLSSTQASTLTTGGSGSGTSLVAAGNIQVGTQLTVTTPAAGTISGVISGSGALLKMGTGKTTLKANNTYTGATAVNAGTLSLTAALATYAASTTVGSLYSSSGFNIASGATLDFNLPTNASSNGNATTFTGTGKVTKTGGGTLTWGSGGTNATKFQLDAGSLLDVQAGSVTASSSNAGDWSLNKSSLNIENGAFFSTAEANVRVDALTGLGALGLGSTSFGGITTGVNNTAAGTYNTTSNTATFSGVISANSGVTTGGTFAKTGSGTQVLTGTNTYTTTNVNGGTLQVGNGGGTGSLGTGAVTLANGANLNYKRNVTTTIANTIEGYGNVNADITAGGLIVDRGINLSTGNITLVGSNSAIDGVGVKINGYTLKATNNETTGVALGKVTITGTSGTGTGAGIHNTGTISGSSVEMTGISTGSGAGISMTGTGSIAATSVTLGAGSGTVKSGDIKLQGTSAGGLGVNVNTSTAVPIDATNDVTIEGISTATAPQQHGVFLYPANKTVQGKKVTLTGRSVNGNAVQTYSAIKATGGDVNITGTSTGALQTASALSLQGEITADQNVVIKGENTDAGNNNAVAYFNKTVQATKGQVDITTSTQGTTSVALQLVLGANLVAKSDVNIKTDTLSIDTANASIKAGASTTAEPTGTVTIKTDSAAVKIDINAGNSNTGDAGSSTPGSRTLGLSNAELNRITAGNLIIGDASNTGGITVSQATTTHATVGNVTLQTGGNIELKAAVTVGDDPSTPAVEANKKLSLQAGGNVKQAPGAAIKAAELQLKGLSTSANFMLGETSNAVGKLAAVGSKVVFANASALEIGEVNVLGLTTPVSTAVSGITTAAGASITTQTGDITITKAISNTGSGDVVLGAGVSKLAGDDTGGDVQTTTGITATNSGAGKTYIYTGSVAGTGLLSNLTNNLSDLNLSSFGSAAGEKANTISHVTYTTNNEAAIADANGGGTAQVFFREAINLGNVNLGASTVNKTYGDVMNDYVTDGRLTADVRSQMKSTNSSASLNTISKSASGAASTVKIKTADLIDALSIAPTTAFDANNYSSSNNLKAYATGYGYTVASGSTYNVSLGATSAHVVVEKKTLTVGGLSVNNKTYDGTKLASVTDSSSFSTVAAGSSVANDNKLVAGDNVSLTGAAVGTYDSKNVAATGNKVTFTGKALSRAVSMGADDASNYTLVQQAQATGDGTISAKTVNLTGTRAYDGTTAVAAADLVVATGVSVNGKTEVLDLSGSGLIASKNVITDSNGAVRTRQLSGKGSLDLGSKSGNGTSSIDGQASNYVIDTAQSTVTINKRDLTLAAVTDSKTYDGTTASSKSVTVSNKVATDSVTASQSYTGKNVAGTGGSTLQVNDTVTIVDGNNVDMSGNYALVKQTASGTIGKATLTLALADQSKVYDGSVDAAIAAGQVSANGVTVSGQTESASFKAVSGSYNSKNVVDAKTASTTVRASDVVSTANNLDLNNYTLSNTNATQTVTGTGKITKANLTLTANSDRSKVYNGAEQSVSGYSITSGSLKGTDTAAVDLAAITAGGKRTDAGTTATTVNDSAYTNGNYAISKVDGALYVAQKEVALSAAKTYDGSKTLTGTQLAITTGVGTETLGFSSATINSKDVKDNNTNYVNAVALTDGTGKASNYKFTAARSDNNSVALTKANLTLTANSDSSKVYNGAEQSVSGYSITSGSLKGTDTAAVDLAAITAGGKRTDAGTTATTVNDSAYVNGNYAISKVDGALYVAQKEVALSAAKTYDGSKTLTGIQLAIATGVGTETLGFSSATINSKDVKDNNTNYVDAVALTDGTGKASNYKFNAARSDNNSVALTKANLTLTANSDRSKVYNGAEQSVSGYSITSGSLKGTDTAAVDLASITAGGKRTDAGTTATTVNDSAYVNGNYAISKVDGSLYVAPKEVALSAAKIYDGGKTLTGTQLAIATGVGTETLGYNSASINSKDVKDNNTNYVNAVALTDGTGKASNYTFTAARSAGNTVALSQANLTLTANSDRSKVYNGAEQSVSGFAITSGSLKGTDTAAVDLASISAGGKRTDAGTTATTVNDSAYVNGNYAISKVDGALFVAQKEVALSAAKTYDGSKTLTGTQLAIATGVGAETLSYSSAAINSKDVKDNSTNHVESVALTDGTGKASNYTFTAARSDNNTVVLTKANLTLTANSDRSKVYNGAEQSVSGYSITSGSLKGTDTAAVDLASITAGGKRTDAGTTATTVNDSAYVNGNYAISKVDGALFVAQKEVALSAAKTYDGSKTLTGTQLAIATGVGAETLSYSSAAINSKDVKDNSTNHVESVALTDGTGKASNYTFTAARSDNNTVVLTKANLTLTANSDRSKVYNGAEQSVSGYSITSGSLKGTDTAAVDLASITAGGKRTDAGTTATTVNDSAYTNGNYAISKVDGSLYVAPKEVALATAKTYDGSKTLTGTQLAIATGVGTETLGFSSASINSKDVKDNSTNYVDAVALTDGTGKASNYKFTAVRSDNNTVALTKANLTLTANSDRSKVYNGAEQSVSGYSITSGSLKGTDTAAVDLASISAGGKRTDAGTTATTVNDSAYVNGNYAISKVDGALFVAQKEVALSAAKTYDGSKTLTGIQLAIATGVGTETLSYSSASINSKDVKDNSTNHVESVALTDGTGKASNYKFTAVRSDNNTVALTKANLTVTLADQTKTYDGTTAATLVPSAFTVKGVTVAGQTETASVHQTVALYNDKNVLGASSVTANLAAGNFAAATGTDLNNYNLPTSVTGQGKITPKDAAVTGTATTVQANGTQQTQSPATKSGFVAGEDVTVSGVATGLAAGTYNSNLTAAPANAATVLSNYKIAYTNAALRINPAIVTNSNVVVDLDLALARTSMPIRRLNLSGFSTARGVGAAIAGGVDSGAGSKAPTGTPALPSQACSPENLQQCECKESGDDGIELCLAPDGKL
ncbi:hypothetical protein B9Z51_05050 [Limnohabitans sp. T6-5]|uniref:filamentous hemagglutinin N-terminal domain-containing protein n=1 Tax=Limnohabitans sp. T6-5 TaxID=1100724 RepID=UPI000D359158|nr:filamentous hemagglutinin N-terminal domain-containing protein [Limnohabitans sp. T6-5]PUE11644.1 hypothetical protein B9Z51_05050 [Limnohabitans sp. T6-5]